MTINAQQFISQIAIPTLEGLANATTVVYSDTALNLCMGTVAQESLLGTYLVQEGGPALGIGQIEPGTLSKLLAALSPSEAGFLASLGSSGTPAHDVVSNLAYAFCLVRLYYWHVAAPLPDNTVSGLFGYYKRYYNSPSGKATLAQWRNNWLLTGIVLPD